jgi:hypothetical protein
METQGERSETERVESGDEVTSALGALQELIWQHPVAFQRAFAALVREGREFVRTPEGSAMREALLRSDVFARSRMIWDVLSMSAFVESSDEVMPSVFIDALAKAAASLELEPILARVFSERM